MSLLRTPATAFVFFCAACSGAADVGLLGSNDGSVTSDGAQSSDSSTSNDATIADGSSQDAGTFDVTQPKEAAPPPYQDPGIACGNTQCDQDADLCCGTVTSYYPQETYSFACESLSDLVACAAGLPIYCDDDHDCASGESCCATIGYQDYSKVACQATACANTVYAQEQHFCDPKNSDCEQNTTCQPAPYLMGYFACQ